MAEHIAPKSAEVEGNGGERRPFRFIMTSGVIAVRDQEAKLWYLERFRKIAVWSPPPPPLRGSFTTKQLKNK